MKLRQKALLITVLVSATLVAVLFLVTRDLLLADYEALERRSAIEHVRRLSDTLNEDRNHLSATAADWAAWDATYRFMSDRNQGFIDENLTPAAFINIRADFVALISLSGDPFFSWWLEDTEIDDQTLSKVHLAQFAAPAFLELLKNVPDRVNGITVIDGKPIVIAAEPILTSDNLGPVNGIQVMGFFFDSEEIARLESLTHLDISVYKVDDPSIPPDFTSPVKTISDRNPIVIRPIDSDTIFGYMVEKDINGKPCLAWRIDLPRDIMKQGIDSIQYLLLTLVLGGAALCLIITVLIDRQVLSRLIQLNREVTGIGTSSNITQRVTTTGNDEVMDLSESINDMLSSMQVAEVALRSSRDEMEVRVDKRTADLSKANADLMDEMVERQAIQEQLRQSQKMEAVGQLAGGIAHDFNNIMTVITGNAYLLKNNPDVGPAVTAKVAEIIKAGNHATALVSQILAYSRKQILLPQRLDLNILLINTREILQRLIGEEIQLNYVLNAARAIVNVDPTQIEQVVINLAINARDAMPEGGSLTIETRDAKGDLRDESSASLHPDWKYVLLRVTDTGEGMNDDTRAQLFEPFFTTKPVGEGSGLGLSTAYGIIKQSEGFIDTTSQLGEGTEFSIYLPTYDSLQVDEPVHATDNDVHRSSSVSVLLAEDEPQIRSFLEQFLTDSGFEVLSASGGEEAIDICDRLKPDIDLLLTDVVMPKLNGRELSLHLSNRYPDLVTLYISGYPAEHLSKRGLLESDVNFIHKPFEPTTLINKIRSVLKMKENQ
jgi:signal transduction histidine kinase